jgi:regulator of RNase E activity RraA
MASQVSKEEITEILELIEKKLYTAVLCDMMDEMGYREQAMDETIRPLDPSFVCAGIAKTILSVDVYHIPDDPYKMEIASVDSIRPGEVVVACTNNSRRTGFWGELLSTAAKAREARGAIIDGLVRDVKKILSLGFPVFARGIKPVDSKGRSIVIDYDCPVECGGVLVHPRDIIAADYDGVVVIPKDIAYEVVRKALEKVEKEDNSRRELSQGAYLRDVYKKYGVL